MKYGKQHTDGSRSGGQKPEQQQASAGEVPEWAIERAYDLARQYCPDDYVSEGHLANAFARYIAAHEPKGEVPGFPLGALVEKISGPEWRGKVVGYYSSTFTQEGLVIECIADGAKGQVHVEPAKRMRVTAPAAKGEG